MIGANPDRVETGSRASKKSLFEARFLFFFGGSPSSFEDEDGVVGIFRVPPTETAIAGTVPVPVASMMAFSACSNNHRTVSPSFLCPNSLVSWKILAAQAAGMRILRPRPSTFVWRSLEGRLGGATVLWNRGEERETCEPPPGARSASRSGSLLASSSFRNPFRTRGGSGGEISRALRSSRLTAAVALLSSSASRFLVDSIRLEMAEARTRGRK